jgi:hypothetical protein
MASAEITYSVTVLHSVGAYGRPRWSTKDSIEGRALDCFEQMFFQETWTDSSRRPRFLAMKILGYCWDGFWKVGLLYLWQEGRDDTLQAPDLTISLVSFLLDQSRMLSRKVGC